MNVLIDGAPVSVEIGGKEWRVNPDFRVFLLLEELMRSSEVPECQKPLYALEYFYPDNVPKDFEAAVERLLWFYHCGKQEKALGGEGTAAAPLYSFRQDALQICAAFWKEYRIDLTRDEVHWWRFLALMEPLISGVDFSEIVRCRAIKITQNMGREEARYYRSMKKRFALAPEEDAGKKLREAAGFDGFKAQLLEKAAARNAAAERQREP